MDSIYEGVGYLNKKEYIRPAFKEIVMSESDILNGSDVLIDGSGLFDDTQN